MERKKEKKPLISEQSQPSVGQFIRHQISTQNTSNSRVAKELGIEARRISFYSERDTLQYAILWKLSHALKHNFLAQLGEYLPYRFETQAEKALKAELEQKNAQIEKLNIQLETLREMRK